MMIVLSLFDGISCGQIAFERLGITFDGVKNKYISSEIKKIAIETTQLHYPNTIQVGDVTKLHWDEETHALYSDWDFHHNKCYGEEPTKILEEKPDIIIGGSPCQNFSSLRATMGHEIDGLDGDKSRLFYEYLRLLHEIKPKYFLLENVVMKPKQKEELDNFLGVKGVSINSNLVSFQSRPRNYCTNIPDVTIPNDLHISFQDYKDVNEERCDESMPNKTKSRVRMWSNGCGGKKVGTCKNITHADKVGCLTRKQDRCPNSGMIAYKDFARYLTR